MIAPLIWLDPVSVTLFDGCGARMIPPVRDAELPVPLKSLEPGNMLMMTLEGERPPDSTQLLPPDIETFVSTFSTK